MLLPKEIFIEPKPFFEEPGIKFAMVNSRVWGRLEGEG